MKYFEGAQLLLWWSPTYGALQELSQSSASHQLKTKHKRMGWGGCLFAGEMWGLL